MSYLSASFQLPSPFAPHPPVLYYGYQPGCVHCETMEPFVRRLAERHRLPLVKRNLAAGEPYPVAVQGTPALFLVFPERPPERAGYIYHGRSDPSDQALEEWLAEAENAA